MNNEAKNDFQIGVECFVEANRKYWEKTKVPVSEDGWIYVLHTLHSEFTLSIVEDIVAKGMQEKCHLPIVSIISGRADEMMGLMDQVDASFGIEHRFHPSYYDYNTPEIETLADTLASQTYGDKDSLLALEYRGICFGDVLYDDILRRGNKRKRGDVVDCFEVSQERYRSFIRNALAIIDQAYEMFDKRKPRYLVTAEYLYTKGLYAHVAKKLGAHILVTAAEFPDVTVQIKSDERQLSEIKVSDTIRIRLEKRLQSYPESTVCDENLFVMESSSKSATKFPEQWSRKKNVVILPHAFGDAPREACRHNIYHDYFEWFLDTVKMIRGIPDVNWIIKDHPMSGYYGQEDVVKSIYEEHKADHILWLPKDYSGMNLKDFADCVITCAGDVGIEYWAYGVPTITVGDAYYCSWGISYQAKTLVEYKDILENIVHIPEPSEQSVKLARKYLLIRKYGNREPFVDLIVQHRKNDLAIWSEYGVPYGILDSADQQLGKNVRKFCELYAGMIQEYDLRLSRLYQMDNLVEV